MEIILASENQGKVREIQTMLKDYPITLKPMSDFDNIPEIIEDGETFYDNALIKARTVYNATKKPTMSEDSGLVVKALNGEPGVRSARYGCDEDEKPHPDLINERVLLNMKNVPKGQRDAYYKAVIVVIIDDETQLTAEGECHGEIAFEPKGNNGFGFDPIFYIEEFGKTTGEMLSEKKNEISHRGRALKKIKEMLADYLKRGKS